ADLEAIVMGVQDRPDAPPLVRAQACLNHAEYLMNRGERAQQLRLLNTALSLVVEDIDDAEIAPIAGRLLWRRAGVYRMTNQHDAGLADAERALVLARAHGDAWLESAASSTVFSQLFLQRGQEAQEAIAVAKARVVALHPTTPGTERFMASVCSADGIAAFNAGDTAAARTHFSAGVDHATRGGDALRRAGLLANLANVAQVEGDIEAAN